MKPDTSRAPGWQTASRSMATTQWGDTAGAPRRSKRVRRWWRRGRRQLRAIWRAITRTITPTGRFVLAATVLACLLGATLGWVEAWALAVAGGIVLLLGLPFLLGGRAYLIRIVLDRSRVTAGGSVRLRVDVENAAAGPALPAVAELPVGDALRELPFPLLAGHGTAQIPVSVATPARGVIDVGPLTLARQDPLGLVRREVVWRDRHRVHVHPRTAALPPSSAGLVRDLEGAASRRLTDADLSFHAVREYVPGDALRHVHWRSTAKTGKLMVRQYEESQTARTAILFDARREEYGSDEEFELGVSVAASLSVQAVREGRERYIASAWTPPGRRASIDGLEELPSRTPERILDAWAELKPADEGRDIEWIASSLARSRRPLSLVALVTGSVPTPERLRRAAAPFPADVAVIVLRCEELAEPKARLLDVGTMLTIGALGDLPRLLVRGSVS